MRITTKIILLTVVSATFAYSSPLFAQRHYPNGLSEDSVNPVEDSLAILQVRAKMDSIRTNCNRPTVALVLCGGGAKGAAEVGALRLIEEMQIPVDMICGTSIGSLLGGMYSVGYDQAFLENLMRSADWGKLLSDKVDPNYFSLATRDYKSKYPLAIPFHYAKYEDPDLEVSLEKYSENDGHLRHIHGDLSTQAGLNTIASSLPSGYVYGFNVNNLFSSLTVGYHNEQSFSDLPIPFCCVSTDLVSCKAKNWTSGYLKQAMRSSMGIPGLFSSVRKDGMVLFDGGMRNNFPVDLARAMGADLVIGIDLTDKYSDYKKVNNAGTVVGQFVAMMLRDSYEINRQNVDVYIRPNLEGYTSLSFSKDAVDTLIRRGYEAAENCREGLAKIKEAVGGAVTNRTRRHAVNINENAITLEAIVFDGLSDKDSRYLQSKIGLDITKPVTGKDIEKAMYVIQATGAVESVTYSLLGTNEPYRLVFSCAPAPVHRLGFSVRLDSEVWAEIGVNFGLNVNRLSGPKLDVDLKIGRSQSLKARFIYDIPGFPSLNAEIQGSNVNANLWLYGMKFESTTLNHQEKIFISQNSRSSISEIQGGIRNYSYKVPDGRIISMFVSDTSVSKGSFLGLFLKGRINNMDRMSIPTKGMDFRASYNFDFLRYGCSSFDPIHTLALDCKFVAPLGKKVALVPDIHFRHVLDQHSDKLLPVAPGELGNVVDPAYSPYHRNFFGGDIAGRYVEHQVPFIGFTDYVTCIGESYDNGYQVFSYDHLAVVNAELRFNLFKKFYLSALGGYAHMAQTFSGLIGYNNFKDYFAGAVQASYQTIVGPLKLRVAYCNREKAVKDNFSVYFSAGFDF